VSWTLHGRRTARGELERRSPWTKLATALDGQTAVGFRHGSGAASDSGDGAVGTGQGEAVRRAATTRSKRRGAVGTPARGLLDVFGLMLSSLLAISQIKSSYARFCI
jgi:hypothetical protein